MKAHTKAGSEQPKSNGLHDKNARFYEAALESSLSISSRTQRRNSTSDEKIKPLAAYPGTQQMHRDEIIVTVSRLIERIKAL